MAERTRAIEFRGRLTVGNAAGLKRRLLEEMAAADSFTLSFGEIEAIDLSFFQLLCAFHRSAARDGKGIGIKFPVSPAVRKAMAGLGFERMMGCAEHGDKSCLWKSIGAADSAIQTDHDA
jgi:anti-anti-sigma regulatory factor